jgi:hypothetical protein
MKSLLWIVCLMAAAPAVAQEAELPAAAVLETHAAAEVPEGTSGAVDRMVRARLDGLEVVRTSSGVALDLSEVQLALGCVGETAECLTPVANELSVRLLVIPNLDATDGELMLTLTLFDREEATLRRVVRQASGENARATLLDAIDGQLRELFELPPAPEEALPPPSNDPSPLPFVLMGIGAVSIGIGAAMGALFLDAHGTWERGDPMTEEEVDELNGTFAAAESYAIAADVLFGVGGAILGAGIIWMIIDLTDGPSEAPSTTFAPMIGPGLAGVSIRTEAM